MSEEIICWALKNRLVHVLSIFRTCIILTLGLSPWTGWQLSHIFAAEWQHYLWTQRSYHQIIDLFKRNVGVDFRIDRHSIYCNQLVLAKQNIKGQSGKAASCLMSMAISRNTCLFAKGKAIIPLIEWNHSLRQDLQIPFLWRSTSLLLGSFRTRDLRQVMAGVKMQSNQTCTCAHSTGFYFVCTALTDTSFNLLMHSCGLSCQRRHQLST